MANAGYGNHVTSDPKRDDTSAPGTPGPAKHPPAETDAGVGSRDATPPTPSNDDQRHVSTPGAGALPSDGAGDDVDPGAG